MPTAAENDDRLMRHFGELAALIIRRCSEISQLETPTEFAKCAALLSAGEATLQLRVDLGDSVATSVWLIDNAGEPLAMFAQIRARTETLPAH